MEILIVVCLFMTVTPSSRGWRCKAQLIGWDVGFAVWERYDFETIGPSGDLRLGLLVSHEKNVFCASSEIYGFRA